MIRLSGVTKYYRTRDVETTALNGISLDVAAGSFSAIMGPSGCGKSTLLNVIGLIDAPSSGQYYFLDQELSGFGERRLSGYRRENIGFVFQNFNLIDELDVYENVELPLLYQGLSKKERRPRVLNSLDLVGLTSRLKHKPGQLSGGQQQRVAIARAVAGEPKLILADEPTGNLDSENGKEVMQILCSLNRGGTTILMVTHSEKDAEYADGVIRMLDGRLVDRMDA